MGSPNKGKGWQKRKSSTFKLGHVVNSSLQPTELEPIEASADGGDPVVSGNSDSPGAVSGKEAVAVGSVGHVGHSYNLRSLAGHSSVEEDSSEHVLVDLNLVSGLFNRALQEHNTDSPFCAEIGCWKFDAIDKVGFGRKAVLTCTNCDFRTEREKLYREVRTGRRGPKSALPNIAVPNAVLQSPIGITGMRHVLCQAGLEPPSRSCLQKHANRAGEKIQGEVEEHLRKQREKIDHPVDVAHDTTYNNRLFTDRRPGQGGTQATSTTLDLGSRKVLCVETDSKLCPHRNKCLLEQCRHRSIEDEQPIGQEGLYAGKAARKLQVSGVNVQSFTSDGDSKAFIGFREVYPNVTKFKDTHHLNRSIRKRLMKENFSKTLFQNKEQQKLLSVTLAHRVGAEFKRALSKSKDKSALRRKVQFAATTIIPCFKGNHSSCDLYSFTCSEASRWDKRMLPENMQSLNMTKTDTEKLKAIIAIRLGVNAIEETHKGFTTQHVEAFNKALMKSAPKSITCSRNFRPRVLSSVARFNMGIDVGSQLLYSAATGENLPGAVRASLVREEKQRLYQKEYKRRTLSKSKRVELLKHRYTRHRVFFVAAGRKTTSKFILCRFPRVRVWSINFWSFIR